MVRKLPAYMTEILFGKGVNETNKHTKPFYTQNFFNATYKEIHRNNIFMNKTTKNKADLLTTTSLYLRILYIYTYNITIQTTNAITALK
jgi:hypothetical protein